MIKHKKLKNCGHTDDPYGAGIDGISQVQIAVPGQNVISRGNEFVNNAAAVMQRDHWYERRDCTGSFMIRFTAVDPACPINLFKEQEPGHRVGEGHFRER